MPEFLISNRARNWEENHIAQWKWNAITILTSDCSFMCTTKKYRKKFHSVAVGLSRSHGSVWVVRTTSKVNGKCWILTPKPPMTNLSDRHQIWRAWLRHGYLPPGKNWGQSVKGFLLPTYAKYTPKCSLRYADACLLLFLVLPLAYSRDACMDFNA